MNINRHNYEEFFILYMDNELSLEDRREVEEFILQHPDLKEELDQLMQFKLDPAAIEFPGKEELWKGSTLIHSGNQTEWLMLYLDGELSPAEKNMVEAYTREDASVQQELDQLQKLKLLPEQVSFSNKEILYRKEEKQRRVVPIFFYRIAAALLFAAIGLGIFFIFNGRGTDSSVKPGLAETKINKKPIADPVVTNDREIAAIPEERPAEELREEKQNEKNGTHPLNKGNGLVIKKKEDRPALVGKDAIALEKETEKKPTNNLPLPVNNPRIKLDEKALAYTKPAEEIIDPLINKKNSDVTNPALTPSDIKTAAFDPNEELEDENGSGKKNRHRGIFRTIARTFEKRTKVDPTEDDKLLVAGFRISLK